MSTSSTSYSWDVSTYVDIGTSWCSSTVTAYEYVFDDFTNQVGQNDTKPGAEWCEKLQRYVIFSECADCPYLAECVGEDDEPE